MDESQPSTQGTQTIDEPATTCSVCEHPLPDHDPIAARFCSATAEGNFKRGCVCTPTG